MIGVRAISDKVLHCVVCGGEFVFTLREQSSCAGRPFTPPKRCPECRAKRKAFSVRKNEVVALMSNPAGREVVCEVLGTLPPVQEKVIRLRFGLQDGTAHTQEEIGQSMAITRSRIGKIEADAIDMLYRRLHRSLNDQLGDDLETLDIPRAVLRKLQQRGIYSISVLVQKTRSDLLKQKGFAEGRLRSVEVALAKQGKQLWDP